MKSTINWIKVEDQLPPKELWLLCLTKDGSAGLGQLTTHCNTLEAWTICVNGHGKSKGQFLTRDVVAWAFLPTVDLDSLE